MSSPSDPTPPNTIDELMLRIEENCAAGIAPADKDIDAVIAYQRKYRANLEAGGPKPKRGVAKPKVKIDISSLIADIPKVDTIKRRL